MTETPPLRDLGWTPAGFALPATDGRTLTLDDIRGARGTLVMFICNHCPYVLAVLDRLKDDTRTLIAEGIGVAAICSNDAVTHPADSFERMCEMAVAQAFPFPYLHDESQAVARDFGAACTPDFFGFDAGLRLRYRGRLDAFGRAPRPEGAPRELVEAMRLIADTGAGPREQVASVGCSIKWKPA